jgi:peptidoglycan/xylan/chitin deacetylase (PgdA/CDA1 family)
MSAPPSAVVLMYHRVAELSSDVYRLCISPNTFREHMEELRRRYRPVGMSDLAAHLHSGKMPAGAVAVTFDDGCLDNLTVASDILQAFDVPATFFITTERLTERHEFWWDVLERIFVSDRTLPRELDLSGDGADVYQTDTQDERLDAYRALSEKIRNLDANGRDALMTRIETWAHVDLTPRETHRPMLGAEILNLSRRPRHDIGAHSVHHLSLPYQPLEVQRREVFESKATLEGLLDAEVMTFAYPYGQHDEVTIAVVGGGFEVAVTATPGVTTVDQNPLALPRIDASQLTREDLVRTLNRSLER